MNRAPRWITPEWPAPANVRAASTLRTGGISRGPFAGFNLADHVGDEPIAVASNRRQLRETLGLPEDPLWLEQVHGGEVVRHERQAAAPRADAATAMKPGRVCAVLTADCLPVLLCDRAGSRVAVVHGGWRGLAAGVLGATVAALEVPAGELLAWLGPAIGPQAFEVGDEVRARFVERRPAASRAFSPNSRGRWLADLWELARLELVELGLTSIHGGGICCHARADDFFSYRRDGRTGRMATLIWLAD